MGDDGHELSEGVVALGPVGVFTPFTIGFDLPGIANGDDFIGV